MIPQRYLKTQHSVNTKEASISGTLGRALGKGARRANNALGPSIQRFKSLADKTRPAHIPAAAGLTGLAAGHSIGSSAAPAPSPAPGPADGAGGSLTGLLDQAKGVASNTGKTVDSWVGNAANTAGNWLGETAGMPGVGNWVKNNPWGSAGVAGGGIAALIALITKLMSSSGRGQ